ncbi:STAS domain-containing protein [Geobacter argillaceus]|uniref:STAS domain-containing protein n=1 Tax=Geobacter argillaceus TaxID=345631 RepID=A0A562W882_9BACT|nr:STAS domain-containing protein [Geobacter argillaceus]TWJ26460.1 STAS domain-containing protein [Geobacter argillaceus]
MSDLSVQTLAAPDDPAAVVVTIAGEMTIPYAGELREHLLAAFQKANRITADLTAVTGIDVAGLQILCSAHRSSVFMKKSFTIIGGPGSAVWEAADAVGQLRQMGCVVDVCHTCIWTGGRG